MSIATECGYRDPREYWFTERVPLERTPLSLYFTQTVPNRDLLTHFVGKRWGDRIAGLLAIDGVEALEVHHHMVIIFKNNGYPWDYIDPAVRALLRT